MRVSRFFISVLFPMLAWLPHAYAETHYPLITYQCDTSANLISITNRLLTSDEGKSFKYADADGTYSPWEMVTIEGSNQSARIANKVKITKTCKLSSGEYTITLEPQVFSRDLTSNCAESISVAIRIELDGIEIQERLPFEAFCLGNAPIVARVNVSGDTGEVKIKRIPKYRFY